jgi:tetratricopeptide (TPR) repeat protein
MKSCFAVRIAFLLLTTVFCTRIVVAEKTWFQVRTDHFSVVTDVGEKRGLEIARRCEQMRAAFSTLMHNASANDPSPLLIFALNGENEVDQLGTVALKSKHAGLFLPGVEQSFILIDASGDLWWRATLHEYAHELLNANTTSNTQTWFDEGFAEYFSTFESTARGFELGRVPVAELTFLRQNGKLLRLADLVRVNQNSHTYLHNGPMQETFYAESWLLVHYLFDHQLIGHAEPFLRLMESGMSLDAAVQEAFGTNTEKLERELLLYAKGERFRFFSLPAAAQLMDENMATQALTEVTVAALKAEIRWYSKPRHSKDELREFADEYRSLLSREPNNAIVLRGLGRAQSELGDYERSFEFLRRAVETAPNEPLNHHSFARLLAAIESNASLLQHPAFSSEHEADRCAELDPSFADAYRLAASGLARRGDFDRAEAVMRRAIALSPRSESYALALVDIELKRREYAPALRLLQTLKNSHDPEIAKQAEYFLASSQEKE